MEFNEREVRLLMSCVDTTYRAFLREFPWQEKMEKQPLGKLRKRLLRAVEAQTATARKADAVKRSRVARPQR